MKIFLRCWICPEHAVRWVTIQRNVKWAQPPTNSPDKIFVLNFETNNVCLCQMSLFRIKAQKKDDMIFWISFYAVESALNMQCTGVPCNVMRSEHGLLLILLTKYVYWILRQTTFVFVSKFSTKKDDMTWFFEDLFTVLNLSWTCCARGYHAT